MNSSYLYIFEEQFHNLNKENIKIKGIYEFDNKLLHFLSFHQFIRKKSKKNN